MKFKLLLSLLIFNLVFVLIQAQEQPTYWWKATADSVLFNYHPALLLHPGDTYVIDSIPASEDYTLIVVYEQEQDTNESFIWELLFNEGESNALTTKKIHISTKEFDYVRSGQQRASVTTVQQSPSNKETPGNFYNLRLGDENNGVPLEVAEVMYFDHRLDLGELRKVQTYLAVKYGITLGPVNLVDGLGNVVWSYRHNADYHHNLIGIGRDDAYGLNQLQSMSQNEGAVLAIAVDSFYSDNASHEGLLSDKTYCIMGDNGKSPSFYYDTISQRMIMHREWKVCTRNMGETATRLRLTGSFGGNTVLLIGRDASYENISECLENGAVEVYLPDAADADGTLYFSDIRWDTDGSGADLFGFGEGCGFLGYAQSLQPKNGLVGNTEEPGKEPDGTVNIYPNPSRGEYNIDIKGVSEVRVQIFNTLGESMVVYEDSKKPAFHFDGKLPSGSQYYVVVTTPEGIQTQKLIIK